MNDVNKIKLKYLGLKKKDKILDIGCSSGTQAIEFAIRGFQVYALDNSLKLINQLRKKIKNKRVVCISIVGDATNLPYDDNVFDAVIATEVFEHITDIKEAVRESYRVLRPGGRACFSLPTEFSEKLFRIIHPTWVKDSGHVSILKLEELICLIKNIGFKIEKVEKNNFEWSVFWLIHSIFRTRFDYTGTPVENKWISKEYKKIWDFLYKMRIAKYLLWVGNKIFPKSYYFYLYK